MLEMRLATEAELDTAYERDLRSAFPPSERKPLGEIKRELAAGEYRPWCLFDGGELLGEAFVWAYVPGFALLDYLCVASSLRGRGLGALLIRRLLESEGESVLFCEAELPRYAADPVLAERRLAFYRRCGAKRAGYESCVFGVPYCTLYWREAEDAALCAAHAETYRSSLPPEIFRRFITIPWDAAMGVPDTVAWFGGEE